MTKTMSKIKPCDVTALAYAFLATNFEIFMEHRLPKEMCKSALLCFLEALFINLFPFFGTNLELSAVGRWEAAITIKAYSTLNGASTW